MNPSSGVGLLRRHHDFRSFWLGESISIAGTQVTAVALPLVATLNLHAGAAGVGAIATASFLPNVALPLLAGVWMEARRKRPVMVGTDILRAVALAIVPIAWSVGSLSEPLLVCVALVVGSASVLFDIGSFVYVPLLVDDHDLGIANRLMQGSITAAQIGGPGLAGVLVQAFGAPIAITSDCISYLASAIGIRSTRYAEAIAAPLSERASILSGLKTVWSNLVLRALAVHASVYNAAFQVFTVNLIVYAFHRKGLHPGLYGLALSAGGCGALFGTQVALRLMNRAGYGRAFAASLVLSCGVPVAIAVLPGTGVRFALELGAVSFISGCGLGSANVLSVTLRQVVIPISALARTNGGYRMLIFGTIPLGSAIGGLIGATLGSRTGVVAGAIGLMFSTVPMFHRPMRTLKDASAARTASHARPRSFLG